LADQPDAARRVALAEIVPEHGDLVDAALAQAGQGALQGRQVAVNVREDAPARHGRLIPCARRQAPPQAGPAMWTIAKPARRRLRASSSPGGDSVMKSLSRRARRRADTIARSPSPCSTASARSFGW